MRVCRFALFLFFLSSLQVYWDLGNFPLSFFLIIYVFLFFLFLFLFFVLGLQLRTWCLAARRCAAGPYLGPFSFTFFF